MIWINLVLGIRYHDLRENIVKKHIKERSVRFQKLDIIQEKDEKIRTNEQNQVKEYRNMSCQESEG